MDPLHEVRLKCLELGCQQAQKAGEPNNLDAIVNFATRFYNHVIGTPGFTAPVSPPTIDKRKTKADKPVDPFS